MRESVPEDPEREERITMKIDAIEGDGATRQAVADWHYWVTRGYSW